ncbi:Do family serine endopeptidase [Alysiella filiformis]|uniref:Probable periplasmic serine endoprotease DegP-like n=1 Tax=Alysiella filiformis DSM 16848 TaxID=1120981 RepID=A0A286E8D6_9NEIS|nr:Do family serine endopeptidase [Alysiella filiformis]QMT32078.1 Do family serine endopeptidase [Alysiella filiformis]UBQ57013.1 Do family serine endopeptidase [Alysiella filiformis DSM 16848]SOD67185.1 serine protease Do [Alysiella filiformis DSM 16848]
MNKFAQTSLLIALSAAFALSACDKNEKNPPKTDHKTPTQIASQPEGEFVKKVAPSQAGNVGMLLPDFAQLVSQEGSTVVNIQAVNEKNPRSNADNDLPNDDPFFEFFKRIVPNAPDVPEYGEDNGDNFGSGVIISADGYILTNAHVIKGFNKTKVTLNDKREYAAKIIGTDDKTDIALLKIDASDLQFAKIGNPSELKSGEWVAAIGAPFGFDNSVTAGIVSAKNRSLPNESYTPFIQTDVAINPGNSGGPLFNLAGQVVGINSQIYSRSGGFMGISFAIPIDVAMNVADQLKSTGKVQRGQLGVIIQEVSFDLAKSFGLDKPTGALISKVNSGSPAEKSGLQVGDIIRGVNGEEVRSSNDLPLKIGSSAPGKTITLNIWRKGQKMDVEVTLGAQSDGSNIVKDEQNTQTITGEGVFESPNTGLVLASGGDYLVVQNATGIAASAGLRRGDIIREVAGMPVRDQTSFTEALGKGGKHIPILVQRGSNTIFMALVLP